MNNPGVRAVTFDQVRDAYRDQVRGLIDGGADLLLLETIFDTLNAKAAIAAMLDMFDERGVELPLMISATITDRSGRTLSGQTLDAFYVSIRHAQPVQRRPELRARRRTDAAVPRRARPDRRVLRHLLSERRTAERVRRVRRAAAGHRAAAARFRGIGLRQHPGRLLRHDARSHSSGRRGHRWTSASEADGPATGDRDRGAGGLQTPRSRIPDPDPGPVHPIRRP